MRVSRVLFLAFAPGVVALSAMACSSSDPRPATLDCPMGCLSHGTVGSNMADAGDSAKPAAGDASLDVALDTASE